MTKHRLQWTANIRINAHLADVWSAIDDLTLIPKYHPDVRTVEYLSGQTRRAPGVMYKCTIPEGQKGWCVEKVIEHVPNRKTSVCFPEDSWGISKMFDGFMSELTVEPVVSGGTWVKLQAYYSPGGLKMRVANVLFLRHMMRKRAFRTLQGLKKLMEQPPQ